MIFYLDNNFVFVLVFVTSACLTEDLLNLTTTTERNLSDDEFILCRNCGSDISSADYIISKSSPVARFAYEDTIFDKDKVLIQVLSSDIFFHFPIFTTTQSTCLSIGEWEEDDSWFPGYYWKPCICPDCGSYVGFVFKPITNSNLAQSSRRVFGLILTNLVGESCKYDYTFLHKFIDNISQTGKLKLTMAAVELSPEDKEFLAKCEDELKDRFTDKDEEFMKVFNAECCKPPVIESWWVPHNAGRRNDRRSDRRPHPYERSGNRDRNYQDRRDDRRGYSDYNRGHDDREGYRRNQRDRPRYN